jgi:hypothetical protein
VLKEGACALFFVTFCHQAGRRRGSILRKREWRLGGWTVPGGAGQGGAGREAGRKGGKEEEEVIARQSAHATTNALATAHAPSTGSSDMMNAGRSAVA